MKPVLLGLAAVAAMALPAAHAFAGACGGGPIDTPNAVASHVVMDVYFGSSQAQSMAALDFAEQQFDPALQAAMPESALQTEWLSFEKSYGQFKQMGDPQDAVKGEQTVVTMPVIFAQGTGVVQLTVNHDLTVAALTFLPAS